MNNKTRAFFLMLLFACGDSYALKKRTSRAAKQRPVSKPKPGAKPIVFFENLGSKVKESAQKVNIKTAEKVKSIVQEPGGLGNTIATSGKELGQKIQQSGKQLAGGVKESAEVLGGSIAQGYQSAVVQGDIQAAGQDLSEGVVQAGTILGQELKHFGQSIISELDRDPMVVRSSNLISDAEHRAVQKRLDLSKKNIESRFGSVTHIPKVAVICSGGGTRSMNLTLGWLAGAEAIGLLDCVTWISTLSGSTWALAPWIQSQLRSKSSAKQFREDQFYRINTKNIISFTSSEEVLMNVYLATVPPVHQTSVTFYGASLANRLLESFGDTKQFQYLSQQAKVVNDGEYPIPLYAAIGAEPFKKEWFAFCPWEVSLEPDIKSGKGFSVPARGFGRTYQQGKTVASKTVLHREPTLGWSLGVFGSAFEGMFGKALLALRLPFAKKFEKVALPLPWGSVDNFMNGMQESIFKNEQNLHLVDAGYAFNLPYPCVSGMRQERMPDIIIFVDNSETLPDGDVSGMQRVIQYALDHNLKLPSINLNTILKNSISVFKNDSDPSVPVVIYIPWVSSEFKTSFDFKVCCPNGRGLTGNAYSYEQAMELSKVMEYSVTNNKDLIWQTIAQRAGIVMPKQVEEVDVDIITESK